MWEVLSEDDGVAVGLDTGQEGQVLVGPALLHSDEGPDLVMAETAAVSGVEPEVTPGEGDLLAVLVEHHVRVPEPLLPLHRDGEALVLETYSQSILPVEKTATALSSRGEWSARAGGGVNMTSDWLLVM